jgi:hypothetical protein
MRGHIHSKHPKKYEIKRISTLRKKGEILFEKWPSAANSISENNG